MSRWRPEDGFLCEICRGYCELQCNGCKNANYCSVEHQKAHWNDHKDYCKTMGLVKVDHYRNADGVKHRVLVACEDIRRGDRIFEEPPLLCGPNEYLKTPEDILHNRTQSTSCIVCQITLECSLPDVDGKKRLKQLCTHCCWPLCGEICREYHTQLECDILEGASPRGFTNNMPPWKFIMILRVLLYKNKHPEGFNYLMKLDIHPRIEDYQRLMAADQKTPTDAGITKIIDHGRLLLRDAMRLLRHYRLKKFATEERLVNHVIQILEWNATALATNKYHEKRVARNGIYNLISAASQSCMPNALTHILTDFKLVCIAAQDIKAGEMIRVSKCPKGIMEDNYQRRLRLAARFITCNCDRCCDPTELKTYHSALKCCDFEGIEPLGCQVGNLLLHKSKNTEDRTVWRCESCNVEREGIMVRKLMRGIRKEKYQALNSANFKSLTTKSLGRSKLSGTSISKMKGGDQILDFIRQNENELVHPNHSFIFEAKLKLCQVLSEGIREIFKRDKQAFYKKQISDAAQLIWGMTEHLMRIIAVLQPGLSYARAKVVFYRQHGFSMHAPKLLRIEATTKEKKDEFKETFEQMIILREETRSVLTYFLASHPNTFEKLNDMQLDDTVLATLHKNSHLYCKVRTENFNPLEPVRADDWTLNDL